ncbi:ADAMTS-like protein 5 [Ambystoma mexicanum]|uniref:ADAMTS-like protein 5 n=1 Tax=Ambystoma mexicanum TaxID=8296 RepID=UPI0037E92D80
MGSAQEEPYKSITGLTAQHHAHQLAPRQWTPWGSWSSCSSECGEGASVRTRKCIRNSVEHPCIGQTRQYRLCVMQMCPPDAVPFRAMQCTLYNSKSIPGSQDRYQWAPFYGAPNSCDLSCLAIGKNFYYTFGRVLDGTKCNEDSEGICINGQCLVAGCDGILGSGVSTDMCGMCRGRSDSCVFIQTVYRAPFPASGYFGYKEVTRIPTGATHIKVVDRSRNFLALMNGSRRYVINGDWAMSWPGVYEVAGTKVHYTRSPDNHESIEAVGPTQEDLQVMVLFQEQNPGIEYEFWLPRDLYNLSQGGSSPLRQPQTRVVDMRSWTTGSPDRKMIMSTSRLPPKSEVTTATAADAKEDCGKCKQARGRSQRNRSYCESDFVFRGRILGKRIFGNRTRYDVQVKHTYKNRYPITDLGYIWVSGVCDCPHLVEQRDYLLMGRRHSYERKLNGILLEHNSYVRPWTQREDLLLRNAHGQCAPSRQRRKLSATASHRTLRISPQS